MFKSIHQLFYDPIKEIDNFCLLKENISSQDFTNMYEQLAADEEKINTLKTLKSIFSHKYSLINICSFYYTNNNFSLSSLATKNETDIETDVESEKSYYSYYSNKYNDYISWIINEYYNEDNDIIKQYLKDILILIKSVVGVNKYNMSKIYEELTKIYFYSEKKLDINSFLKDIKLLSALYGYKEDKNDSINNEENNYYIKNQINHKPYNYYYFTGKEVIQINPVITSIEKSKINEGFSIFICFNCLLNPTLYKYIISEKEKKEYNNQF